MVSVMVLYYCTYVFSSVNGYLYYLYLVVYLVVFVDSVMALYHLYIFI